MEGLYNVFVGTIDSRRPKTRSDEDVPTSEQPRGTDAHADGEPEQRDGATVQVEPALEARVRERTRIVRDLHDTLLQGFQGLLLQFEAALTMLPGRPDEARTRLISALDRATLAVTEARDAVEGLRTAAPERDLLDALRSVADEFTGVGRQPTAFSMEVIGVRRRKNPLARDEIARVTGEALRNAFRHSHARRISVTITYTDDHFHLQVRDDGTGMDLDEVGRPQRGYFGLRSMRQHAEAIGARLDITSTAGAGTVIDLRVPAVVAYASAEPVAAPPPR
jgi:signal transduction histidine kinase